MAKNARPLAAGRWRERTKVSDVSEESSGMDRGRTLTWWQFLLLVLVYAAIIQIGGRTIGADVSTDEAWETAGNVLKSALIPVALSSLFVIAVATWLRWWPQIVSEPMRVQRWVRIVPVTLLLAAAIGASWGNLLDQQAELVLVLVVLVLIVGFTEELMFRGVGLVMFRRMGLTEGKVALYSSIVFGAVHLSNALGTGTNAIFQAIVVSFTGYMLYLTRRWAGAIWLAMPVHSSQDFLVLSGQIGVDPETSPLSVIVIPVMLGLAILLWHRRHRTEPERSITSTSGPSSLVTPESQHA
jgi:membrane protease YdiL (CAAX protease family)